MHELRIDVGNTPDRAIGKVDLLNRVVDIARGSRKIEIGESDEARAVRKKQHQVSALARRQNIAGRYASLELQHIEFSRRAVIVVDDGVRPIAPAKQVSVVACATLKRVVARATGQRVIAVATVDHIVATQAIQRVVAAQPKDCVVAAAAVENVVALGQHIGESGQQAQNISLLPDHTA